MDSLYPLCKEPQQDGIATSESYFPKQYQVRCSLHPSLHLLQSSQDSQALKLAWPAMMMPMMTPNSPSALPKISTTRIFTNRVAFCASDSAALLPTMPTHTLQAVMQMSDKAAVACHRPSLWHANTHCRNLKVAHRHVALPDGG